MPADLVLRGKVRTGDPLAPLARAVAVRAGVVVALDEDALALAGSAREVGRRRRRAARLRRRARAPAVGRCRAGRAARPGRDIGGRGRRDRPAYAGEHPDEEWIQGGPYEPTLVRDGLFDARWLDDAVPDRPVVLQSSDHHCVWANSIALARAGVDATTPDPAAGSVARRPDGTPLGTLVEWTAMDLVLRHAPEPTAADRERAVERATALLASAGVTWAQEAALAPADVGAYLAVAEAGGLSVRVNVALRAEPGDWPGQRADFVDARARALASPVSGEVSVRTVKFFADGVLEAGTAALLAPYDDRPGDRRHPCGLPVWDPAELAAAAAAFDADGFQLHIHAIGDAASGRHWTRCSTSRPSTGRATAGRSSPTPSWSTLRTCRGSRPSVSSPTSSRCGPSSTRCRPS